MWPLLSLPFTYIQEVSRWKHEVSAKAAGCQPGSRSKVGGMQCQQYGFIELRQHCSSSFPPWELNKLDQNAVCIKTSSAISKKPGFSGELEFGVRPFGWLPHGRWISAVLLYLKREKFGQNTECIRSYSCRRPGEKRFSYSGKRIDGYEACF